MARFTTDSPHINRDGAPTQQARVEAWYKRMNRAPFPWLLPQAFCSQR